MSDRNTTDESIYRTRKEEQGEEQHSKQKERIEMVRRCGDLKTHRTDQVTLRPHLRRMCGEALGLHPPTHTHNMP